MQPKLLKVESENNITQCQVCGSKVLRNFIFKFLNYKNMKKSFFLTLSILFILAILFYGYTTWWKESSENNNKTPVVQKKNSQKVTSQKTYINNEYGISINYPNDWFALEEDDIYTKEKFITFSNLDRRCNKGDCPSDYLAFFIRIYSNTSDTYSEFVNLKSKHEELATTKEVINFSVDKKINFFLVSKQNEKPDETWDMIKPAVKAFFRGVNNSFVFYIATEIPSGSDGQQIEVDVLRESLKTFKINK